MLTVETHYDAELGCEWGYKFLSGAMKLRIESYSKRLSKRKGVDIDSLILITPPKQLTSVYFNPHGVMDGSAYQPLENEGGTQDIAAAEIRDRVQSSREQHILFLSPQPDRCRGPIE